MLLNTLAYAYSLCVHSIEVGHLLNIIPNTRKKNGFQIYNQTESLCNTTTFTPTAYLRLQMSSPEHAVRLVYKSACNQMKIKFQSGTDRLLSRGFKAYYKQASKYIYVSPCRPPRVPRKDVTYRLCKSVRLYVRLSVYTSICLFDCATIFVNGI